VNFLSHRTRSERKSIMPAIDLSSSPTAPPEWWPRQKLFGDIAGRLERLGFWEQSAFVGRTEQARLDFLAELFERNVGEGTSPEEVGFVTQDVRVLLQQWLNEYRDGLNEDLSRILLGEALSD
jgi:hypothetical protein